LGHARIVERLLAVAQRVNGPAVVFTFDPHPGRILRPEAAPAPLSWTRRKARLLGQLGVDAVIAYPTDRAFLGLDAREFFDRIICERLAARALVEGPNFFFGRGRGGTIDVLRRLCAEENVILEVVGPLQIGETVVSSSRIRRLIMAGGVEEARSLLGRPYRIRGTVVTGERRGAKLGYPTANIEGIDTLLPSEGIYAGLALVDATSWPAALSVGPNPTFDETALKVEAYLVGYEGSLYGRSIEVDFLARLRDIKRFHSADDLVTQVDRDVAATRQIVSSYQVCHVPNLKSEI